MRKIIIVLLTVLLVSTCATPTMASNAIRIFVNGNEIYSDVSPQVIDGRTMVPIRVVAEALGTNVNYDSDNEIVSIDWNKSMESYILLGRMMDENPNFANDVIALVGKYSGNSEPSTSQTIPSNQDLELVGTPQITNTGAAWFLVGYVRNNSNYTYSFVNVGINLLDSDNNVVSKIYAKIKNLPPGDVGKFISDIIIDRNTTGYQITDISGR